MRRSWCGTWGRRRPCRGRQTWIRCGGRTWLLVGLSLVGQLVAAFVGGGGGSASDVCRGGSGGLYTGRGGGSIVWVCPAENYEGTAESMQTEETENLYTCARTQQCQCGGGRACMQMGFYVSAHTRPSVCARPLSLDRIRAHGGRRKEGRKEEKGESIITMHAWGRQRREEGKGGTWRKCWANPIWRI